MGFRVKSKHLDLILQSLHMQQVITSSKIRHTLTALWCSFLPGRYTGGGVMNSTFLTPLLLAASTIFPRLNLYWSTGQCCRDECLGWEREGGRGFGGQEGGPSVCVGRCGVRVLGCMRGGASAFG